MKRVRPLLHLVASLGALLSAACSQYVDRKDTVAFSAGKAVETNMVTHVIDPWPPHAWNTRMASNGERMQKAVERHRQNRVTDPGCARPSAQGAIAPATSGGTPCAQPAPQPSSSAAPAAASDEATR